VSALKHINGRRDRLGLKNKKNTENFNREKLPLQVSVCYNVSEESKRETRVSDSLGSPLVETAHDFTRRQWQCCMFPSAAKITCCWKVSNNPQTTTTLKD
jgi:hypothetical protein